MSLVLAAAAEDKHRDPLSMRALGFCVSIAHAEFMARKFTEAGLPSAAVSADTDTDDRSRALNDVTSRPRQGTFRGGPASTKASTSRGGYAAVPPPDRERAGVPAAVGTRPAARDGKDCVTVLDFIGQAHRQVPVRPAVSRRHRRHAHRGREADRAGIPVPACRLLDAARSGGHRDRARQHPPGDPVATSGDGARAADAARLRAVPRACSDIARSS